jgi:hypothetical protein
VELPTDKGQTRRALKGLQTDYQPVGCIVAGSIFDIRLTFLPGLLFERALMTGAVTTVTLPQQYDHDGDKEEEDPFDAFGSDDDDDDDDDVKVNNSNNNDTEAVQHASSVLAKSLESANQRLAGNITVATADPTSSWSTTFPLHQKEEEEEQQQLYPMEKSYLSLLEESLLSTSTCSPPLYQNPNIRLVSSLPFVGGGRGYIATRFLSSGTCVLVEEPIMTWPSDHDQLASQFNWGRKHSDATTTTTLVSCYVRHLLGHADAQRLVYDFEEFHPTKVKVDAIMAMDDRMDLDEATTEQTIKMMKQIESEYSQVLDNQMCLCVYCALVCPFTLTSMFARFCFPPYFVLSVM